MEKTYYKGIIAEFFAKSFLKLKGYRIRKSRDKHILGEIDIVAEKNNLIIFVEVKFRHKKAELNYAVSNHQVNRIRNSSLRYFREIECNKKTARIDVILISWLYIKHIKNAFPLI